MNVLPEFIPQQQPIVITVAEQIASLNYQYMRMMLIMSALLFGYVLFNFYFRDTNAKTLRIGKALDGGALAASLFMLIVSIIYFTEWM